MKNKHLLLLISLIALSSCNKPKKVYVAYYKSFLCNDQIITDLVNQFTDTHSDYEIEYDNHDNFYELPVQDYSYYNNMTGGSNFLAIETEAYNLVLNDEDNYLMAFDESYYYNYYNKEKELSDCFLMPNYSNTYNSYFVHDISMIHHQYVPSIVYDITKEFCKDENLNQYLKDNCLFGVISESSNENVNTCYNTLTNNQNIIHSTYSSNFLNEFDVYTE